jgi:E3 SUMO-protein ligase PIAS1
MVKTYSAQELTQQIIGQRVITKESVLAESKHPDMIPSTPLTLAVSKKANDPDIEFGSSVMSLKDPISTLRIKTPCRSMICTHNQCFDAESFLLLQEQAPTWTCPICSKIISFNGLAVDQYVQEILSKVKNADQVTIEASGEWSLDKTATPPRNGPQDDSDDDLIEILDYRVATIKEEATLTPTSLSTPPLPSRETSTVPRSGNKRTAEVVDLTLSDDDEPPRPAKKVAYRTPSSIPDPSHRYQLPPIGHASAENARIPPFRTLPQSSRSDRTPPPTTSPDRPQYTAYPRYPPPARPNYPRPGSHHSIYSSSSP